MEPITNRYMPPNEMEYTILEGVQVLAHSASACVGEDCVIHNPSDHHMRDWPVVVRSDKHGLIERVCEHGTGHPDPDSVSYFAHQQMRWMDVHGCCGCCVSPEPAPPKTAWDAAREAYKDGGRGEECAEAAEPYFRAQALRDAAQRWRAAVPDTQYWAVERVLREWADEEEEKINE